MQEKCNCDAKEKDNAKPLTLDEAIAHAQEVAYKNDTPCGREHAQLAAWLRELKERLESNPRRNCDRFKSWEDARHEFERHATETIRRNRSNPKEGAFDRWLFEPAEERGVAKTSTVNLLAPRKEQILCAARNFETAYREYEVASAMEKEAYANVVKARQNLFDFIGYEKEESEVKE